MKRLPLTRRFSFALTLVALTAVACGESPVSPVDVGGADLFQLPPQDGGTKELPPRVATATLVDPADGTVVQSVTFCSSAATNTITLRISLKNFDVEWVAGTFTGGSGGHHQPFFFFPDGYRNVSRWTATHWAETNLRYNGPRLPGTTTGHVDVTIIDPDSGNRVYDNPYRIALREIDGYPTGFSLVWPANWVAVEVEFDKTSACTEHIIN